MICFYVTLELHYWLSRLDWLAISIIFSHSVRACLNMKAPLQAGDLTMPICLHLFRGNLIVASQLGLQKHSLTVLVVC